MTQNFVTGAMGLAEVTTDLMNTAGPAECGVARGQLEGNTLTWSPAEMVDHCQNGMVSCQGNFCGMQGSPPQNMPFVYNDDCGPYSLNAFMMNNGVDGFTMPEVVVSMGNGQTTKMMFVGTATGTQVDPNTPMCACG